MTLNLSTHHQMGAHYGWDKLRLQTQKGLMGQVCYGSCSGRLGLGLVLIFKALEDKRQAGKGQLHFQLIMETLLAFPLPTPSFSFLAYKMGEDCKF